MIDRVAEAVTDLEMTKLCAEAMGWRHLGAVGVPLTGEELRQGSPSKIDAKYPGKLWCLSGHNDWWESPESEVLCQPCYGSVPNPLNDDAQAMALVKRFKLQIIPLDFDQWTVMKAHRVFIGNARDLNRAIVECVAKMHVERKADD